jgi:hypothetical protein
MDLKEFLDGNDWIDVVEVVTFTPHQPNFVILKGPEGRVTHLTIEMRDIKERLELGILKSGSDGDPSKGQKEALPGGRVLSFDYLAAPGFDLISGVRIRLDVGDLIVTAGDMPYSIFVSFGDVQRGRPEYPINEYRSISVT